MKKTLTYLYPLLISLVVACSSSGNEDENKSATDNAELNKTSIFQKNEDDSELIADTLQQTRDSIILNTPFDYDDLQYFKKRSDSIIRIAINQKEAKYDLTIDTVNGSKNDFFCSDYFENGKLQQTIKYWFKLQSSNRRYSFWLYSYEYKTEEVAKEITERVATASVTRPFGLAKCPSFAFRYKRYLFWLDTPCSLSGGTFNKLKESLSACFNDELIDHINNHYEKNTIPSLQNEGINGKWRLKPIAPLFADDTTSLADYSDVDITFTDSVMKIDNVSFSIASVRKLKMPDVQAFFLYNELIYKDTLVLNPELSTYSGDVIKYTFYFDKSASIDDNKYDHRLFKELSKGNFIKISDTEFGYLNDGKLYVLEKRQEGKHID